jgi:hypothetical protein
MDIFNEIDIAYNPPRVKFQSADFSYGCEIIIMYNILRLSIIERSSFVTIGGAPLKAIIIAMGPVEARLT